MSETRYYYADYNNVPVGPYTADQLRQLQAGGQITTSSLVVEEGQQTWQPYGNLLSLKAAASGIPMPPVLMAPPNGAAPKDRMVAGLLAIFLGSWGVHKFYLGFNGPGLVFLLVNTIGWTVTWILLGLPNIALGVVALIEGIIYLTKSDQEFQQTYVIGKKQWL